MPVTKRLPVGGLLGVAEDTVMIKELFASEPSTLKLPAASENLLLATLTTPLVVLLAFGVNVTV